jgi:hypothetical protein
MQTIISFGTEDYTVPEFKNLQKIPEFEMNLKTLCEELPKILVDDPAMIERHIEHDLRGEFLDQIKKETFEKIKDTVVPDSSIWITFCSQIDIIRKWLPAWEGDDLHKAYLVFDAIIKTMMAVDGILEDIEPQVLAS